MLWIWTNGTKDKQLMNVKTLECMERPPQKNDEVMMKTCNDISDRQIMTCTIAKDGRGIVIGWKKQRNFFLYLKDTSYYAIYKKRNKQRWSTNETQPCGSKITYAGKKVISVAYQTYL